MITTNLPTLQIHKLSQAQYVREDEAGNIDGTAFYLTPDEGVGVIASGEGSHAEGYYTTASGRSSHAEGEGTIASCKSQHAQGEYNIEDTEGDDEYSRGKYIHIVGNGTSNSNRSNAHTLDWDGNAWFAGKITVGDSKEEVALKSDIQKYIDEAILGGAW